MQPLRVARFRRRIAVGSFLLALLLALIPAIASTPIDPRDGRWVHEV